MIQTRGGTGDDGVAGAQQGTQSVDRAVTVLEIIAGLGEASVSEIATAVDVHRSTISRLLAVLETRGLGEVAGSRGRYRLGLGILRLAGGVRRDLDVSEQGAALSAELAVRLGETVNIAVLRGDSAVNIHQAEGGGAITVNSWVGRPTPLHATSSGKVLLAALPPADLDDLLGRRLDAFTAATITDPGDLRAELAATRENGFAVTVGELEEGLNAVAAPVYGPGGIVIAALSVSAPGYRMAAAQLSATAREVIAAAADMGLRMGYLP
ncbi:MAG: IclR family transcriptional regulator [Burkholderiaceae bacterium]|nr:IclR family transcriptional regulator [Microbacteriaceae bacterium]